MSPLRALGGRVPFASALEPRSPQARRHTLPQTCITESFDGADSDTIGPDVDWDQHGWALDSGPYITGFGVGGHVKDNRCSLYAPPDPPGGDPNNQWLQVALACRTQDTFASDVAITTDMHHVGQLGGPGNEGNMIVGWCRLYARMETDALDPGGSSFPFPTGWWVSAELQGTNTTVVWRIQLGWNTPTYTGTLNGFGTVFSINGLPPDTLGLTVVGQDMDLVVTSYADGAQIESYTMDQIINDEGYTDVLDDPSYLPRGERVGFELYGGVEFSYSAPVTTGSYHGHDDDVWIDNFEACPA